MHPSDLPENQARRPLRLGGLALLWMSFQTLGIIYSDIGTSPLYVLNGIWPSSGPAPSTEDVIGGVSAIVWSLTIVPLIKYVCIVLRFGTKEGEGGTFALYHGLFPPVATTDDEDRALTGESAILRSRSSSGKSVEDRLSAVKWPLMAWTLFGTGLVLSDGILTPAVSVTSAVAGIALSKPEVGKSIGPISIGFLLALFLAQRFGTHRLAFAFAPITAGWLALLGATGIYNIVSYPGIMRAFDPSRAVMLFVRTRQYDLLAGILLAVTGCEALFANLGQFNKLSIQLTFGTFVYPMLVLAYLGQGAKLITDGDAVISNIFYSTIPGGVGGPLYWIVYIFAILASECCFVLIASQAMITASFSVVQQVINMRSLPPLLMKYTSETVQGQVYIPFVNYTLAIATVIMVAVFKDLAALTNAYGFAVSTVMFITTTLVAIQFHYVKRQPWIVAILFLAVFGFVDGLFWGASLRKVPHGAWVTLMIGSFLALCMLFWTWAKGLEDRFDGANRKNLGRFIVVEKPQLPSTHDLGRPALRHTSTAGHTLVAKSHQEDSEIEEEDDDDEEVEKKLYLLSDSDESGMDEKGSPVRQRKELVRLQTCAVFHKLSAGRGVPHTFYGFLRQWPALPRVVIFLSVRVMNINHVELEDRYNVTRVRSLKGFYGVTYSLGFRDDFDVEVHEIVSRIVTLETRAGADDEEGFATAKIIEEIQVAVLESTTHIVPHYHVVSRGVEVAAPKPVKVVMNYVRQFLIEEMYRPLAAMFPETANWIGSADEIIRVGINAEI